MKSPLQIDKDTQKKYGITPESDISPIAKLSFLQEQLGQIEAAMWRARVDVVHAQRLKSSDNQVLQAKGHNNEAEHLNQVEQFTGAIKQIKQFIKELREEYPELKVED